MNTFIVLGSLAAAIGLFLLYKFCQPFLIWFAGAEAEDMKNQPDSVKGKRAGLGMLMLMVAIFSSFVVASAWPSMLGLPGVAGVPTFCLWFMVIWPLERAVIQLLSKDQSPQKRAIAVILRLLIVFALSFLNSKTAEMQIFKKEIDEVIVNTKKDKLSKLESAYVLQLDSVNKDRRIVQARLDSIRGILGVWISEKEAKIQEQKAGLREREQAWSDEIAGRVGSHIQGNGEAAKAARQVMTLDSIAIVDEEANLEREKAQNPIALTVASAENDAKSRQAELDERAKRITRDYKNHKETMEASSFDGFSHRDEALSVIAERSILPWFVFLFFLVMEMLPIFLKLMQGRDSYDEAVSLKEAQFKQEALDPEWDEVNKQIEAKQTAVLASANAILTNKEEKLTAFVNHVGKISAQMQSSTLPESLKKKILQKYTDDAAKTHQILN